MNWILDNLQLVLVASGAVAYWLNQRRQAREERENPPAPGTGPRRPGADAMEQEQETRRIQEEIRRKIQERRGLAPAPAETPQEPPPVPRWLAELEEEPPRIWEEPAPPAEDSSLARQRELSEQMDALRAQESDLRARADQLNFPGGDGARAIESAPQSRRGIRDELRGARSLRRAVLLREVLGPPVGLR